MIFAIAVLSLCFFQALLGSRVLLNYVMKIINHGLQCNFLHRALNGIFDFVIWRFKDFANILRNWTGAIIARMNSNKGSHAIRLQCGINLVWGKDVRKLRSNSV